METLSSEIRIRVESLKEIQGEHDELEAKFLKEREELEAKYQKLYEPLYTKRSDIVNGVVEVDGVTNTSLGQDKTNEGTGVPDFWLTALKTNENLAEEISERDEEALKYLKDIKWSRTDNPNGFKLDFLFDTNPFFKNLVLTKTYRMADEKEPMLEKAIGTQIEWYPGKCLTQKILKKKTKKGAKDAKPIMKTEKCESFFNFFSPPEVTHDEDDIDEDEDEEVQDLMEQDYDIGSIIRDRIIPYAVSWFTGEAVEDDEFDMTYDNDDEAEDADEEDNKAEVKSTKKKSVVRVGESQQGRVGEGQQGRGRAGLGQPWRVGEGQQERLGLSQQGRVDEGQIGRVGESTDGGNTPECNQQ